MKWKIAPKAAFWRFLLLFVLSTLVFGQSATLARPHSGVYRGLATRLNAAPTGRLVVQFEAAAGLGMGPTGLQVRQDGFFAEPAAKGQASGHLRRITALVQELAPGSVLSTRLPTAVREAEESGSAFGRNSLTRYAHFETGETDPAALDRLAARLVADPAVARAWPEPEAIPAVLNFGEPWKPANGPSPADAASGSFVASQGYLGSAPAGVGALDMRTQAGALGAGVTVIDVEGGWLWSHEDLPAPVAQIGNQIDNLGWRNHGTAVVGVIRGQDNAVGVTGIAPACAVGQSSIGSQATSEAILAAAAMLSRGDVIVIELHAPGPGATGVGQEGYVPMEFWPDNFDAIQAASRRGIMVLEAAGNGQVDLDAAVYEGLFDPTLRHSGAIMIGATDGSALDPAWFTNHGQRVDLNGWGFDVTTLAYGDLQGSPSFPEAQWYTAQFNGTSSATPVVTGAVVSLVGMVRARHGFDLDARLARDLLRSTGTPANGPQLIGARPNLVAAYALADTGIGQVSGFVTDLITGLPVSGALVSVQGGGTTTLTAADGSWQLPLLTGPVSLEVTEYSYEDGSSAATITPGGMAVVNFALLPLARVDIAGVVYGGGQPRAGARLQALHLPLPAVDSQADGSFVMPDVPVGKADQILIFGVPGFGARVVDVTTVGATANLWLDPVLSPVSEDFSLGDGGFAGSQGLWTRGTPPIDVPGAFTGTACWGIGLDGLGYADDQADTLTSPAYDLAGIDGPYYLSFHYFSATEAGYDGVNLAVSTGGAFTVLEPVTGYPDRYLGGLGQQAGWSGASGRWTGAVFDLSGLTGGPLRFRLAFGSDGGVTAPGFFIDGISFGRGVSAAPVRDEGPAAMVGARLNAWPNPFNPRVSIAWSIPRPGPLSITVFDLRGRRVTRLLEAPVSETEGTLQWNGQDDAGRGCASGVYFVQLRGADGERVARRIVLAR
jgi:hypothetical protein